MLNLKEENEEIKKKDTIKLIKYFKVFSKESKELITIEQALEILEEDELGEFVEHLEKQKQIIR